MPSAHAASTNSGDASTPTTAAALECVRSALRHRSPGRGFARPVAGRAGRARAPHEIGDKRALRAWPRRTSVASFQDSCTRLLQPAAKKPPLMAGIRAGFVGAIGWTPLIKLTKLSAALGRCDPREGGIPQRAGRWGTRRAGSSRISKGGFLARRDHVEGTAGNTGIGLALVGLALVWTIVMPDQAAEKYDLLRAFRNRSARRPFRLQTRRTTTTRRGGSQRRRRARSGPISSRTPPTVRRTRAWAEIVAQTGGTLAAFVAAAGTGGTIAGVGRALKAHDAAVAWCSAIPYGSALYNYVKTGELTAKATRTRRESASSGSPASRPRRSTTPSGSTTQTMVEMAHWLVREEGLFVGGSAALNRGALYDDASGRQPRRHRAVRRRRPLPFAALQPRVAR